MRLLALLLLCLTAATAPVNANALVQDGTGRVSEIVDGDTLVLQDGRQVRLVGIQAPKLPLGRPNFRTWPLAGEAKAELEKLAQDRLLTLSFGGRRTDRYKRLLAHLHDGNGTWIQGRLLQAGMARVYSFSDNRAAVAEMLALEREARAARRGIWRHPFYHIRKAEEVHRDIGGFHLVEGRVRAVATRRGWTYVNFGEDWRTDFTVSVRRKHRRLFEEAGVELEALTGRLVRVRGWVSSRNGPMIEATHPEQIEVID